MDYYSYDISGRVVRETPKARLIRVDVGSGPVELWFPKSQCRMRTNTSMEIPGWILEEKENEAGGPIRGVKETTG